MIEATITISNDGVDAARKELKDFLRFETDRMAGERPGGRETAALGYVVLRRLLEQIEGERKRIQARDRAEREAELRRLEPTVREARLA